MSFMSKNDSRYLDVVENWCQEGFLTPLATKSRRLFCDVRTDSIQDIFPLESQSFQRVIRLLFKQLEDITLSLSEMASIMNELEIRAVQNPLDTDFSKRVYGKGRKLLYELGNGKTVKMYKGVAKVIRTPRLTFYHNKTFANQVLPNLNADPTELPALLGTVLNLKGERQVLSMTLHIVASFMGPLINVPIYLLSGEKGSAKSTALRRIEQIIDPKIIGLGGAPRSLEALELRMHNSYFLTMDNLSRISVNVSDTLCRGCTGGSVTKRMLYSNTEEVVMDLKCIIAINGVSVVVKESDLMDRCILYKFSRISKEEMRTERELDKEFEKVLPDILGCCFQLAATALADKKPVKVKEKTRLCDFFDTAIKIGRALSYDDQETAEILWANQNEVNSHTLGESIVAQCVLELMEECEEYKASISALLGDLKEIAERNNIHYSQLPKQPNQLSRQLNQVKENLAQAYGLYYDIRNVGAFKEIHIYHN
jgi:hypothetical protein